MMDVADMRASGQAGGQYLPHTRVLGVRVSLVNMRVAVKQIIGWTKQRNAQFVCIRDVHGIMRAQEDPELHAIYDKAGMVTPDGMPLVWLCQRRGAKNVRRVCGGDLVDALCEASVAAGVRHFFFGGKPGVAERVAEALTKRYPGLQVAGILCPPFGKLSADADREMTETILRANPDVVWVGLSTPKQEFWMRDHVGSHSRRDPDRRRGGVRFSRRGREAGSALDAAFGSGMAAPAM